jgi:hypothetical protein
LETLILSQTAEKKVQTLVFTAEPGRKTKTIVEKLKLNYEVNLMFETPKNVLFKPEKYLVQQTKN